jgi:hypothetical protein
MATFPTVPPEEAQRAVLPPRRATQEQYREYVRGLEGDTAGQLEPREGDKPISERARTWGRGLTRCRGRWGRWARAQSSGSRARVLSAR